MTFSPQPNGRTLFLTLKNLTKDFGIKARRISKLSAKIGSLAYKVGDKPSLFPRIEKWLMQLSLLKKKEMDTLAQIQSIEKKHALLRRNKKLRLATPRFRHAIDENGRPIPSRNSRLLWLLFLLAYVIRKPKPTRGITTLTNG